MDNHSTENRPRWTDLPLALGLMIVDLACSLLLAGIDRALPRRHPLEKQRVRPVDELRWN